MKTNGKRRDITRGLRGDRKRRSTKTDRRLSHHRARQMNRARLNNIDLSADVIDVGYDMVPYARDRVFDGWEGIHDYGVNTSVIDRIIDHLMSSDPAFADDGYDGRRAKIIVRYGNSVAVRQACDWNIHTSERRRYGYPRHDSERPRGPEADLLVVTSNGAERALNQKIRADAMDNARYSWSGYTLHDPWSLGLVETLWAYRGDRHGFLTAPDRRDRDAGQRWARAMSALADVAHEIAPDPNYRARW